MLRRRSRLVTFFTLFGMLLLNLGMLVPQAAAESTSAACVTFPETGKQVCDRFLEYWQTNGGLAQQGLPLTDVFDEVNPTDGKTYKTQYFERARFEMHPENQAPYDVLLGLLGREQLQAKYPSGTPARIEGNPLGANCADFPQTEKNVCGVFLDYWMANGGLAQQGLPLTNLFLETNPTDGKPYPTQYFERARFEYHVENKDTPYVVLLGLLGREQLFAKYPNGDPKASPSPSPSPSPSASPSSSPSPNAWGPTLAPLAGGTTYTHANGRFTVSAPTTWAQLQTTDSGVILGGANPVALCTISADSAPPAGGLAVLDAVLTEVNQSLTGYAQVSKDQVVVRGQQAYRQVITFKLSDGSTAQGEQVYFIAGPLFGLVFCITDPGSFASAAPTFDGVAGSLKLAGMAAGPAPVASWNSSRVEATWRSAISNAAILRPAP